MSGGPYVSTRCPGSGVLPGPPTRAGTVGRPDRGGDTEVAPHGLRLMNVLWFQEKRTTGRQGHAVEDCRGAPQGGNGGGGG